MAVMITAIIFVLATNARAEEFDYVSAMKKAEKEINAKNYIQAFNTIKEIGKNAYHQNNPMENIFSEMRQQNSILTKATMPWLKKTTEWPSKRPRAHCQISTQETTIWD